MTDEKPTYNLRAIRQLLLAAFTAEELLRFCQDRPAFRPIVQRFGLHHGFDDMVDEVVDYCQTQDLWGAFLAEVEKHNPGQYARHAEELHKPDPLAAIGRPTAPVSLSPFNLPPDLADFTGREAEIAEVRRRLSEGNVVVISGMGGIGKTALALHVAHQLADEGRFRDARLYVDLKGADPLPLDPAAALGMLLTALLGPDPRRPAEVEALADLWRRAIHGKDAVLVLDNAYNAAQVRSLLPGCATCAVLVTSRRRFALAGAGRLDLEVMDPEEARALLWRLAPRLERVEEPVVDRVAGLCGRLPLALRVAGNYLALNDDCPPERYAEMLADERGRLERLRAEDDPDLDVHAALSLSVARLDEETRRAWALLALLPAAFDVPAAAALWGEGEGPVSDEGATLDRLQALRNRSLVTYDVESDRYDQHDLLRLVAARRLEAQEAAVPAARQRLARHFMGVAQEVERSQNFPALDADWPHLQAALVFAEGLEDEAGRELLSDLVFALNNYLSTRGLAREWAHWCRQAAAACAAAGDRHGEGTHLGNLGSAYFSLGDAWQAIDYHQQALAISREICAASTEGSPEWAAARHGEGVDLGNLGNAYYDLGEARQAIDYHQQALAISREVGDRRGEGNRLGTLGLAYAALGETRQAIKYYQQALAIAREIGDRRGEGNHLGNLGNAHADLGEPRQAIDYYQQALDISREIGDRRGEGVDIGNLGLACTALGETRQAIDYYRRALAIAREIGDRRNEGSWLGNLGLAYFDLGEARQAINYYQQALAISREIGDRHGEETWLGNLGAAYFSLGETRQAIDYHQQALAISREIGDRRGEGADLGNLGLAYAALGEIRQAIDYHEQTLTITREIGDRHNEGTALDNLGSAYATLGETRQAINYFQQALAISREIGDRQGEENSLGNLGAAYADLEESRQAIDYYQQALVIAREIGDRRGEGIHLGNLGLAYKELGKLTHAREYWTQALSIYEIIEDPNAERVRDWLEGLGA